uniref:Uncharacterized protein n=2 Tax=Anguilla anguilla TaxID=7936 RepID=A0A0E9UKW6_ANGAN
MSNQLLSTFSPLNPLSRLLDFGSFVESHLSRAWMFNVQCLVKKSSPDMAKRLQINQYHKL